MVSDVRLMLLLAQAGNLELLAEPAATNLIGLPEDRFVQSPSKFHLPFANTPYGLEFRKYSVLHSVSCFAVF